MKGNERRYHARRQQQAGAQINPDDEIRWQDKALCPQVDPEIFFPEKGGSTKDAKRVCMMCEVRAECLQAAFDKDERFGIFGGFSERERRRFIRSGRTAQEIVDTVIPRRIA